ncbi:MAG: ATP synthase F0 subunit B [Christensenellales bacterium]
MNIPLNINFQQILLHLLNFVILAGGLYFLLYGPVKKFMDGRQKHYSDLKAQTEDELAKAKALEREYRERLSAADAEIAESKARQSRSRDIHKIIADVEKKKEEIIADDAAAERSAAEPLTMQEKRS